MLKPRYKKKFQKDLKKIKKQGKNLNKIQNILNSLVNQGSIDRKYLDHPLKGEYVDCRECHIEPDWLLIYFIEKDVITFIRTGSHAELFK